MSIWMTVLLTALSPQQKAEKLFSEGRTLLSQGRVARACDAFEASFELDPALGTVLNLAACTERLGKAPKAWRHYGVAQALATQRQDPRLAYITQQQAALKPRLAWVELVVGEVVSGMMVSAGPLREAVTTPGTLLPVEPGEVSVRVTAPAMRDWSSVVKSKRGEVTRLFHQVAAPGPVAVAPPAPAEAWELPPFQGDGGAPPAALGEPAQVQVLEVSERFPYYGIPNSGCAKGRYFAIGELSTAFDQLMPHTRIALRLTEAPAVPAGRGATLAFSGLRRAGRSPEGVPVYCRAE